MPRRLVYILPVLLAAGLLAAAETPSPPPSEGDGSPPAAEDATATMPLPRPAPTFTPREKISADSAVAFPVDI